MIVHKLPHSSKFLPISHNFRAVFDAVYDFSSNIGFVNIDYPILLLQPETIYFIDTMQTGSNLSSESFNAAIINAPGVTFKKSISGDMVYSAPLYVRNMSENRPITAFMESTKKDEYLLCTCTGKFRQLSDMIGLEFINISMGLQVYAMNSKEYQRDFRNEHNATFTNKKF